MDLIWDLRARGDVGDEADEEMRLFIEGFQAASRQFVKRQLTWFRSDPTFRWIPAGNDDVIMRESMMPEVNFHDLYNDEKEQEANRQEEASKQAQQALKRYVAARSIYNTPEARKPLLDAICPGLTDSL
uniref:tRNA dimethylallyltransferase n=1 Tax=Hemiselmis andersenii TaxID=464988 RepID=A0A7S0XQA3_HEMAN